MEDGVYGTDPKKLRRSEAGDTSTEASENVNTSHLERRVLELIVRYPGLISDEVRRRMPGLPYSSVTARFKSLIDKGLIRDTGERRPGSSGRSQRVLEATVEGHKAVRG